MGISFQSVLRALGGTLLVIWSVGWMVGPAQADARAEARIDADRIGTEDILILEIVVQGADPNQVEQPDLGELPDFKVVGGPSTSTEMQFGTGGFRSSLRFTYNLLARGAGHFTLGPFQVAVAGTKLTTNALAIEVAAGRVKPQARRQRDPFGQLFDPFGERRRREQPAEEPAGEVFVLASLDQTNPFVGAQATLTYTLYTQVRVQGLQLQEEPTYTGFWSEPMEFSEQPKLEPKTYAGKQFYALPVRRIALFPTAPGKIKIQPATFAINVATRSGFMPLFDDVQTVFRKTKELELDARPLPAAGKPAEFSSAVGSFGVTASVDKNQAKVGDVVTLKIEIRGTGNLGSVVPPALPALKDFKVFDQKTSSNIKVAGGRVGGAKVLEALLQPIAPGEQIIEGVQFAYFDLATERYRTLSTSAIRLQVTGDAAAAGLPAAGPGSSRQEVTLVRRDIRFLKPLSAGRLQPAGRIYARPWYWGVLLLPLVLLSGAYLAERERQKLRSDIGLARLKGAHSGARRRLRAARRVIKSGGPAFHAELARALLSYVGDRFNRSGSGLTREEIRDLMAGLDPEVVAEYDGVLETCDAARFAGEASDLESRSRLVERAESAIRKLHQALERRL